MFRKGVRRWRVLKMKHVHPTRHNQNKRPRQNFTLIDLLAALAIIVILMGMLLSGVLQAEVRTKDKIDTTVRNHENEIITVLNW